MTLSSGKTFFVPKIENGGNQPDKNSRVKQRLINHLKNAELLNDDLITTRLGDLALMRRSSRTACHENRDEIPITLSFRANLSPVSLQISLNVLPNLIPLVNSRVPFAQHVSLQLQQLFH